MSEKLDLLDEGLDLLELAIGVIRRLQRNGARAELAELRAKLLSFNETQTQKTEDALAAEAERLKGDGHG